MGRFGGLFDQLVEQRLPLGRLIQDAGHRGAALGRDDLGDPVADQLAVGNGHGR